MKKWIFVLLVMIIVFIRSDYYDWMTIKEVKLNNMTIDKSEIEFFLKGMNDFESTQKIEGATYELSINQWIGESVYTLILDYNFDEIVLQKDDLYFKTALNADYFYAHSQMDNLYDYVKFYKHEVNLGELLDGGQRSLKYMLSDGQWREMTETYGQELNVEVLSDVILDVNSRGGNTSLTLDGKVIDAFEIPNENGLYELVIHTVWEDSLYIGEDRTTISLSINQPMKITQSSSAIEQGEVLRVFVSHSDQEPMIESDYMDGLYFNPLDGGYECLIPSTYYTSPGLYKFKVTSQGNEEELEFEVLERDFRIQYLTVSSSVTKSTQTNEGYEQYRAFYKTALLKDTYSVENRGPNPFILPTTGRLTTEFGENRYVNNKKTSYHHAGWDIANDQGTPVYASGDGHIVLSKELIVTGNSIVISHGQGLFTTYFHMDELIAEEGDLVSQGTLIGKMGTTGFSTGNHLHFSISYYQMNLEPGYFIYNTRITKENYEEYFNQ